MRRAGAWHSANSLRSSNPLPEVVKVRDTETRSSHSSVIGVFSLRASYFFGSDRVSFSAASISDVVRHYHIPPEWLLPNRASGAPVSSWDGRPESPVPRFHSPCQDGPACCRCEHHSRLPFTSQAQPPNMAFCVSPGTDSRVEANRAACLRAQVS